MKTGVFTLLAALTLGAGAPATTTVHIVDFAFKPAALTVHTGDSVVFQNDDPVTHNVSSDAFQSADIDGGKSWKYTFTKEGTFAYVCTYHPGMKATITVTAAQTDSRILALRFPERSNPPAAP